MPTIAVIQFTCDSCSANETSSLAKSGHNTLAYVPKGWYLARRYANVDETGSGYMGHDDSSPVLCAECTVSFLTWVKGES